MVEQYFTEKPHSRLEKSIIDVTLLGQQLSLVTGSGTFSFKKLDRGTEVLITFAHVPTGARILDLGCGNGVIGIAMKKKDPSCEVVFTDINERALLLTKENLTHNDVVGVVKKSNVYSQLADEKFDVILSNVPQKAGKDVCLQIIQEAPLHLRPCGSLQIVARHNKGGKTLMKAMEERFGNVSTLCRKSGYHVYCGVLE